MGRDINDVHHQRVSISHLGVRKRRQASKNRSEAALLSPKPLDEVELDAGQWTAGAVAIGT